MRDGSFRLKAKVRGNYSKVAQDDEDYIDPKKAPRYTRTQLRAQGSLRSYIDNIDSPDNEVFQRFFQTTIQVVLLWMLGFAVVFPEMRLKLGLAFGIMCLVAFKLTWL